MHKQRNIELAFPSIGEEEIAAVSECLRSGWLVQGPRVEAFEKEFARLHGAQHAIACSSCTTGLHLCLAGLGIGPGDEVIVPSFTWIATANVVVHCGATPVIVDIERDTFNIDPRLIAERITERTKAIIAVALFGLSADIDAIKELAPGIPVIEDAACAAASIYKGRSVGTLGYAAAFSFHPRKSVTTGEGGMVTTADAEFAAKLRRLRSHGASMPALPPSMGAPPHIMAEFDDAGFNYRMTDFQAALGLVQLSKLESFTADRRQWATFYDRELRDLPWLTTPRVPAGYQHSYQAYVVYIDEGLSPASRNEIMLRLKDKGIGTRPGTHAVHILGYYADRYGLTPQDCPTAWDCYRYSCAIPLHNQMGSQDFEYVVEALHSIR